MSDINRCDIVKYMGRVFQKKLSLLRRSNFIILGGCDGCLNIKQEENGGPWLQTVAALDAMYDAENLKGSFSRADFYHLASLVAIDNAAKKSGVTMVGDQNVDIALFI